MHRDSGQISTNTGVQPSQTIELVVATNENGVVIISPVISKALIAIWIATVPLVTNNKCWTSRKSFSSISSWLARGPMLVSHWRFQIPSIYFRYSSFGGRKGLVTGIIIKGFFTMCSCLLIIIELAGMSLWITQPAPMITLSPMVTPFSTITLLPSQQFFPILMGAALNFWCSTLILARRYTGGCGHIVSRLHQKRIFSYFYFF